MNRLIFRVWNPATKRMIKPSFDLVIEFHSTPSGVHYIVVFEDNKRIENAVLMQDTGLILTNGQKVFAGDIVKDEDGKIGLVEYDDYDNKGLYYRILYRNYSSNGLGLINPDESEVIGNIYENPELWEEQNGIDSATETTK